MNIFCEKLDFKSFFSLYDLKNAFILILQHVGEKMVNLNGTSFAEWTTQSHHEQLTQALYKELNKEYGGHCGADERYLPQELYEAYRYMAEKGNDLAAIPTEQPV